jgi:acyl dehydratase
VIAVDRVAELLPFVGQDLGISDWVLLDEAAIASFGTLTGDTHWIHMDPARARGETPFGGTIAHGYFVLALVTGLSTQCYAVRGASRWMNYGLDRVRFTAVVPAGSRLRLKLKLLELDEQKAGTRLRFGCTIELEGSERPAAVCEWICIAYEEEKS